MEWQVRDRKYNLRVVCRENGNLIFNSTGVKKMFSFALQEFN